MTGSLQTKNNIYYAVINLYDENGKRKPKWISTGYSTRGNKKKAEKFLKDKITEYELNQGLVKNDILFSDYIRKWLKDSAIRVDEVTLQSYEATAKAHVLPYFDKLRIKLIDVNQYILQEYINSKYSSGRKDGSGGLSAKTLYHHKNILRQALKEAVNSNLIHNNPFDRVVLPKLKRYDYNFYNEEQIQHLFNTIKDEPLFPLIKVTVTYGLRRSEVLGLKWDSVDLNAGILTIKHTVSMYTTAVETDTTKTNPVTEAFL